MVICKCQANISGNHSNKYVSEAEFGGFLSEALKGTYAERADLISLFSSRQDGGSEVSLPNLYKVGLQCYCYLLIEYISLHTVKHLIVGSKFGDYKRLIY